MRITWKKLHGTISLKFLMIMTFSSYIRNKLKTVKKVAFSNLQARTNILQVDNRLWELTQPETKK